MNENPVPPNPPAEPQDLATALDALQKQVHNILVLLVVVVAVLDVYMLRQWVIARKEVKALEPGFLQMKAGFDQVTVPLAANFLKQLNDYAKTHPDFQPILARYPIQITTVPGAPALTSPPPGKAPGPTPAPPPAKPAAPAPKR